MADQTIIDRTVLWFIPWRAIRGRTDLDLARTFVFTHLFGPLIAQPMSIYLYVASPRVDWQLVVMMAAICSFWTLPFLLRFTGSMKLAAFASFQLLAAASLFGAFNYGGFSSPFLPWLVVSLMLGLFYLSGNAGMVLSLFALNIMVFFVLIAWKGFQHTIPIEELRVIGWLSITSATIYMTWMALYYSRIIGLRAELEIEIDRQRSSSADLEKARASAEKTCQARTRFFDKMSHELRTPLNAIIGYSDILLDCCESDANGHPRRKRDVTRINAAGKHLLSLVADVLDVNRIEEDVMTVEIAEFELGQLCDEVVATALPMIEKNGNVFSSVCQNRDHVLRTDPTKLRQILLNLLSNAGKFTERGSVKLHLFIGFDRNDAELNAIVSDTGLGISAEAVSRLFTDFEQADATTFSRFGGTGLGLALSRRLAILLGGNIMVSSRPGQGSQFAIAVPATFRFDAGARLAPAAAA